MTVAPFGEVSWIMTERRYTDTEVAAILARATESEHAALPVSSDGMTLGALQEIGREVGIAPDLIAQAARSMELAGQPVSRRFLGFPIAVGRTVVVNRPLSDADWEGLVSDLRDTFQARGTLRHDGSFRQWTNPSSAYRHHGRSGCVRVIQRSNA